MLNVILAIIVGFAGMVFIAWFIKDTEKYAYKCEENDDFNKCVQDNIKMLNERGATYE